MPRTAQPREGEPIRIVETKTGPRYRAVVDIAPAGAPRRQQTKTFDSIGEARAWVQETRERVAKGNFTAPDKITLAALCEDWLSSRRDVRTITVNGYRNALRPAIDHLGTRAAQSITRRDVENLVDWAHRKGGQHGQALSQRSVVYLLGTLKQVLAYGVAAGILPTNVAQGVKAPRRTAADKREPVVWTVEQMLTFRAKADTDSWAHAHRLLLSGLRRSEVCGLSWSNVDLTAGTVTVAQSRVLIGKQTTATDDPKSSASRRTVPVEAMHSGTITLLKAAKVQQAADRLAAGEAWTDTGLVVVNADGTGVHPDALAARWRKVAKDAGVPVVGPHSARHAVATLLHAAGAAPADVAALLGHEVTTHLQFYVQGTEHGSARAAASLGTLLGNG